MEKSEQTNRHVSANNLEGDGDDELSTSRRMGWNWLAAVARGEDTLEPMDHLKPEKTSSKLPFCDQTEKNFVYLVFLSHLKQSHKSFVF